MSIQNTPPDLDPSPSWLERLRFPVSLIGAAALGYVSWRLIPDDRTMLAVFWIGLLCWVAEALPIRPKATLMGVEWVGTILLTLAGCLGGLANTSLSGLGLALVIAALVRVVRVSDEWLPVIVVAVAGLLGVLAGGLGQQPGVLLTGLLTFTVVLLLSLLRRNVRRGQEQQRRLLVQQLESERERAENAALAERARLAGELHDVLAHSLGALTAQLNAAEALLIAGQVDQAQAKVTGARVLAAEGLAESRRAVAALRGPGGFEQSLSELVRIHRESGEQIDCEVTGTPRPLPPDTEQVTRRIIQELLTNARKHAPGQPVDLEIAWTDTGLTLATSNPIGAAGADPVAAGGLGHGLTTMRERCQSVGGTLRAGRTPDDEFTVTCILPVPTTTGGR